MESITLKQHEIEYQISISQIKEWREKYKQIISTPLKKSKEYYSSIEAKTKDGKVSRLICNDVMGMEYPQIVEHLEEKGAIKKIKNNWAIMYNGFNVNNYYLEWSRMADASQRLQYYTEKAKEKMLEDLERGSPEFNK